MLWAKATTAAASCCCVVVLKPSVGLTEVADGIDVVVAAVGIADVATGAVVVVAADVVVKEVGEWAMAAMLANTDVGCSLLCSAKTSKSFK